jgi:predicted DCC family thiol-disulfide oxidoreductase YuxK
MAPSCALDGRGLRLQLQRYRSAGRGARLIDQTAQRLVVELDPAVEGGLIDELLAVERECCPFLTLDWEPDRRRLAFSVSEVEHEPALDGVAFALDLETDSETSSPPGADARDRTRLGRPPAWRHIHVDDLIVLYDGDCGFCRVVLALLLRWDRAKRVRPIPIQSALGEELLTGVDREDRLSSWHLIDACVVRHSGGAGITVIFDAMPGGALIARLAARFPRATSRTYDWVASHRVLLGRPLGARSRAWAARVIADHQRGNARGW